MTAVQDNHQGLDDLMKTIDDHVKQHVVETLIGFADRLRSELDDGEDLDRLETDAACLLSDLCKHCQLTDEERACVLGPKVWAYIQVLEEDDSALDHLVGAARQVEIAPTV